MNIFTSGPSAFVSAAVALAATVFCLPASAQDFRANRMVGALAAGQQATSSETWTFVDTEHAPFNVTVLRQTILNLLSKKTATGQVELAPIVRIPAEGDEIAYNRWMIKQALESGAMGIIVPKVETAEEAGNMVAAMRYPQLRGSKFPNPQGLRGGGGPFKEWGLKSNVEYQDAADVWPLNPKGELIALPMIETRKGVENINAILDVPGIAGVLIGPSDFSLDHGVRDSETPDVQASIKKVADACVAKKKHCGIVAFTPAAQDRYQKWGFKVMAHLGPNSFTPAR